jgi:hypothetical protein
LVHSKPDPWAPPVTLTISTGWWFPTASLNTVSLSDLDFGSLLGAFGGTLRIFVTLSLLDMRPAGSDQQVIPHK